ncbi:MAG: hypothetical protein LBD14_00500 [Puniceicoccales bacterium]|jgi:general secretion pathway protein D|nr:hypothetical protein [Puniceicoccales bacterium]
MLPAFSKKTFLLAAATAGTLLPPHTILDAQNAPAAPQPPAIETATTPPPPPAPPIGGRPGRRPEFATGRTPRNTPTTAPKPLAPNDIVGPILLVDESLPQVIALFEKLSGKTVLRTQTLPILKINLNADETFTRTQAITALETLLAINGVSLIPQGDKFFKATPIAGANTVALWESPPLHTESTLDLPPSERVISRLFTLNHISTQTIEVTLNTIVNRTRGAFVLSLPITNSILYTDSVTSVQKAEKIVASLDVPNKIMFFKIKHVAASEIMRQLNTLRGSATGTGAPGGGGNPMVMPGGAAAASGGLRAILPGEITIEVDAPANQLMVIAPQQLEAKLRDIIAQMDQDNIPKIINEVISLRHTDATTIFNILLSTIPNAKATGGNRTGTGGGFSGISTGGTNGGLGGTSSRTNTGLGNTGTSATGTGYTISSLTTRDTPTPNNNPSNLSYRPASSNPQASAATTSANIPTDTYSRFIDITADDRTNRLIISATEKDLKQIKDLVTKIDEPLAQVRIEAIIVEVTLGTGEASGLNTLGLGYKTAATTGGTLNGDYKFNTSTPSLPNGQPPFSINGSLRDFSLEMIFNQAESNSRVRILSAPLIHTSHNQPAMVSIGQRVPYIGSTTYGNGSLAAQSNMDFEDINLELNVTPRVGADGSVEMQVQQSSKALLRLEQINGNPAPVTATRSASSYLIANHNETIVLAGLQAYREAENTGIVWLLGYIPLIGELFKPKMNETERTEIIVFLKPYIIDRTQPGDTDTTPGLHPGALTRVDAKSYIETGRFSAISLTKAERDAIEQIRRRQNAQADATRRSQIDNEKQTTTSSSTSQKRKP